MDHLHIPKKGGILPNMVRSNMPAETSKTNYPLMGIAQSLFSEVQLKVLVLLFGQPNRSFQMSEILSQVNSGVWAVLEWNYVQLIDVVLIDTRIEFFI